MGRSGTKARNRHRAGAGAPVLRTDSPRLAFAQIPAPDRPLASPRRRTSSDSVVAVRPAGVRAAVSLQRASQLTGLHPVALEVLSDLNRLLAPANSPKRVRLMRRLADYAAAAGPVGELSRAKACRLSAWCAREALRRAGVADPRVETPLKAMVAGEPVSLLAVGEALVALEAVRGDTDKAAGRARYACEVALGLCSTGEDWRERMTLAARHATAAVSTADREDGSDLERFFASFTRRLVDGS